MESNVRISAALQASDKKTAGDDDVAAPLSLENQLPTLRHRLMRQARVAVFDSTLAEDLVQETLLALFEQESRHRGQASRLDLTAENCRMILHRARMGMRGCMQHNWLDAKAAA